MICILVGLPARGKTYVAHKLSRYLSWLGYCTKAFNVGNYRRTIYTSHISHDFFDPNNEEALKMRKEAAEDAMSDLLAWIKDSNDIVENKISSTNMESAKSYVKIPNKEENQGRIAIYDATNSTKSRRLWILSTLLNANIKLNDILFIELICNDDSIIESNILQVKLFSPDYVSSKSDQQADTDTVLKDFKKRISHYEKVYETLEEHEWDNFLNEFRQKNGTSFVGKLVPMIKVIDVGRQMILRGCKDFWHARIGYYLMNLHIAPRAIYLCRHGESLLNVEGRIGGDSDLSDRGWMFARALPEWIQKLFGTEKSLHIWTSTLKRTIQTAQYLNYPQIRWKALDELCAGKCDSLTYEEIEERYPEDFHARDNDKFYYRYPDGGESYADLVIRLEPIMMELERQTNVLVIGHQAVLRAIYAYFMGLDRNELPYVSIPLHTIMELKPKAYGCSIMSHPIGIPAVNTQRDKPSGKLGK